MTQSNAGARTGGARSLEVSVVRFSCHQGKAKSSPGVNRKNCADIEEINCHNLSMNLPKTSSDYSTFITPTSAALLR